MNGYILVACFHGHSAPVSCFADLDTAKRVAGAYCRREDISRQRVAHVLGLAAEEVTGTFLGIQVFRVNGGVTVTLESVAHPTSASDLRKR